MSISVQVKNYQLYTPYAFGITVATTDPTTTNDRPHFYAVGSLWINSASGAIWACVDSTAGAAVWEEAGVGSPLAPPSYSLAARNALSSPATGQVIYNTTTKLLSVYNGTAWYDVGVSRNPVLLSVNGAIPAHVNSDNIITKAGVLADTLGAPVAGTEDGLIIKITSNTAFAHTITATGLLQTGTIATDVLTFAPYVGASVTLQAYNGKWNVVAASGVTANRAPQVIPGDAAVGAHASSESVLTKGSAAALTLGAPVAGSEDGLIIKLMSTTAFAHVLTATGLLQTGTANVNVATFAAFAGASLTLEAYNGKWIVIAAVGITFS